MHYKTFDVKGNEIKKRDLQNKGEWCIMGAEFEEVFIRKYSKLELNINPDKLNNPYVPDLLDDKLKLADLKTQNTPFFLSRLMYNIDPQFAVTFNDKDYLRYKELYKGIDVYFWIDWQAIRFVGIIEVNVLPMKGVWKLNYENMLQAVSKSPLHFYSQRVDDQKGNAKRSYVLNLNSKYFERLF